MNWMESNMKTVIRFLFFLCIFPLSLMAWKMESGSVTLPETSAGSTQWQDISFVQTYDSVPLVFALVDQGSGYSGDTPVVIRIKNVSETGCQMVQVEAQSVVEDTADQGPHPSVNVHYLVIEEGDYTLPDGTRILAGTHTTQTKQGKHATGTKGWDTISLDDAFSSTPVVLSMVQTVANETADVPGSASIPWLISTIRRVETDSFEIALERAETSEGQIDTDEEIAYLLIDANVQGTLLDANSCSSIAYETILTGDEVKGWDNACKSYNFSNAYTHSPNVIGNKESRDGGDGGWLRRCSLSTTSVGITVDEDQAADSERKHTSEVAGMVIFADNFVYDSTKGASCELQVNFRMDECYWLGGANGVDDDVIDSSENGLNAQSRNNADNTATNSVVCRAGDLNNTYSDPDESDAVFYPNETTDELAIGKNVPFSISAWLYRHNDDKWMAAVIKVSDETWLDGWGLVHTVNSGENIDFFVDSYTEYARTTLASDTWTHIVATYDGNTIRLYKNGVLAASKSQSSYNAGSHAVVVGDDVSGNSIDDRWQGGIDEVKVWGRVLRANEISDIYNHERNGLNFDGTVRECKQCNGSSVNENSWDLIGIPVELRDQTITVNDLFGDDMNGTYEDDWILYKRTYSTTDNSSGYEALALNDALEFGIGYWLGSRYYSEWYIDGLPNVDYNSTDSNCVNDPCVEINLTPVTHNFDEDGDDGTGPYRYNMSGFIGLDKPVKWADCRFIIDGTAYTPSDANASGFANKQIWMYNGTGTDASNSYITCDDTMECKLVPFKGFWIELHGATKGKTVKLLIPKE
jgi:hypothetical protein